MNVRRLFAAVALCCSVPALPAADVRIVSLAPHLTSLAFDAGAGGAIVGTVEHSNHPDAARGIPRVGNAFQVDVERVVALAPDVVLAWESGTPSRTIAQIERVGLDVIAIPTYRIADVAVAIRRIGALAGTESIASAAAGEFERSLAAVENRRWERRLSVFIQVDDEPLYTVSGEHIISELVERCGGVNVFADLEQLAPVIGMEAVIATQPEVILSTDDTILDPAAQWQRWPQIPAVALGTVYSVPADLIAQATTRLLDGLAQICANLQDARRRMDDRR